MPRDRSLSDAPDEDRWGPEVPALLAVLEGEGLRLELRNRQARRDRSPGGTPDEAQKIAAELAEIAAELAEISSRMAILARRFKALEPVTAEEPEPPSNDHRLLTATQVMALTGLPRATVYRLAREGALGAVRIGTRSVKFSERALDAWLAAGGLQ